MCTKINMEDFIVVHHEMGHIMYYLNYKDQPLLLRGGANPAFHEAIGDTIALSVSTPKHLEKIGLLKDYADSEADNINALFKMALERIAFLPFGLLIDQWRWNVFSGKTQESDWNKFWWTLREGFQEVSQPNPRDESFFDPGAKYHVPADSQYIGYFYAHILEFQFYRSLCIEAGQYDPEDPSKNPLHKCDFFENKKAGQKLAEALKLGMSEPWSVALEKLTGESEVSADAMLEYFAPLQKFLDRSNEMYETLRKHNVEASRECNKLVKAEYAVATDTLNQTAVDELEKAVLESAKFTKEQYERNFKGKEVEQFGGETLQRQLKVLTVLGTDALEEKDLKNVS
jgi:peptidyl-dipeptidase A